MNIPHTEAELAEAVASAKGPLAIRGGGTRPIGRPVLGETLSTAALSGITLYEPGALTLVAKAGTPVAEIEAALDSENQMLAFEPMDHRTLLGTTGTPTIGGVVATNASGPRRIAASGACRDALLGVRYVDGRGTIIKNGGRVMKNVTGYDLTKLMAGSYGTLGVLSEVSLKLLPKPELAATIAINGLSPAAAATVMSRALGSPFEVSGAAYQFDEPRVILRVEGFEQSVLYRARELAGLFNGADILTDDVRDLWQNIRNVAALATYDAVWRVHVAPSQAVAAITAAQIAGAEQFAMDWGGGLVWVGTNGDAAALQHALQGAVGTGHVTRIKGAAEQIGSFHPEPPSVAALTGAIRAKFDPRGILNPGLMN